MTDTDQVPIVKSYAGIRLVEFNVDKLFDEFDYNIPLNLDKHVTAIIAPNGTGKTLCLRMISGLFEQRWNVFADNIFSRVLYKFNEGTSIEISKTKAQDAEDPSVERVSIRVIVKDSNDTVIDEWTPRLLNPRNVVQVERYIPFLTRIGPNAWRHDATGENYTFSEVVEEFGDSLPERIRANLYGKRSDILAAITSEIDCHLIETQRLLILRDDGDDIHYRPGRRPPSTLAIARKAQALKTIISQQINVYATLSQSLDRSFPKRVMSHTTPTLPSEELKVQLQDLDEKRKELMDAGILDTEADDPVSLPEGPLEDAMAGVLSVYVDHTRQKLATLSGLLAKIKLFKDLIDERFITKDVRISRQNGIEVIFKNRNIPIERLSSREQHQLVLFFELLFDLNQNSLILIDEPELSLHVAWHKKFIADLMQIIDLNRFDVLLATHSPQLVSRWNDLVIELGDVYEGETHEEDKGAAQ